MIKIIDKAMYLPQGDTATVNVFDAEFLGLTIADTDKLLFLITDKSHREVFRRVLEPVEGVFTLTITQEDNIPVGEYLWQVRQYVNGVVDGEGNLTGDEINTPLGPRVFKVMEVLGNGELHT